MSRDHTGQGYNFSGEKVQGMAKRLAGVRKANAARIPCSICGNLVLPEKMDQHTAAFHED